MLNKCSVSLQRTGPTGKELDMQVILGAERSGDQEAGGTEHTIPVSETPLRAALTMG